MVDEGQWLMVFNSLDNWLGYLFFNLLTMPKQTNNWEERFDKGWARNNPEHPRIAKREAVKDFIRKEIAKAKQEERERLAGKEKEIIELLETMTSYYFKGGEYEDQDLYCEDMAKKILNLLSKEKEDH